MHLGKKKKDEAQESGAEEREATEGGFGTGLRAQLLKRQNPQTEEQAPEPAEQPASALRRLRSQLT